LVFHDYLYPYLGIGFLIICGGGVYYFYKLKTNVKPPVEQIKIKPLIKSSIKSMD
jgi:hypothetical protein